MNQTTISHWLSFPWVCSNLQLVQCITTFKNKAHVTEFFVERLYQPFCIYIGLTALFRINSETFICKFNSSSQRNPSRLSKINWKRSNPVNGDEDVLLAETRLQCFQYCSKLTIVNYRTSPNDVNPIQTARQVQITQEVSLRCHHNGSFQNTLPSWLFYYQNALHLLLFKSSGGEQLK